MRKVLISTLFMAFFPVVVMGSSLVWEKVDDEIDVIVGEFVPRMEYDHYIMWIAQVSDNKTTRIRLYPEQGTEVRFKYIPKSTVYAYCNKHGLWKTNID